MITVSGGDQPVVSPQLSRARTLTSEVRKYPPVLARGKDCVRGVRPRAPRCVVVVAEFFNLVGQVPWMHLMILYILGT